MKGIKLSAEELMKNIGYIKATETALTIYQGANWLVDLSGCGAAGKVRDVILKAQHELLKIREGYEAELELERVVRSEP